MEEKKANLGERLILIKKGHNDKVYAYLQTMSYWNKGELFRYVRKKDINQSTIAKEIGMSQSAVSRAIEAMITKYEVIEEKGENYNMPNAKKGTMYYLIDPELNLEMAKVLTKDCLKVYGLLAFLFTNNGAKSFVYKSYILQQLGMGKSGQNLNKIRLILNTLISVGLLELEDEVIEGKYGKDDVRYKIIAVNSKMKEYVK